VRGNLTHLFADLLARNLPFGAGLESSFFWLISSFFSGRNETFHFAVLDPKASTNSAVPLTQPATLVLAADVCNPRIASRSRFAGRATVVLPYGLYLFCCPSPFQTAVNQETATYLKLQFWVLVSRSSDSFLQPPYLMSCLSPERSFSPDSGLPNDRTGLGGARPPGRSL